MKWKIGLLLAMAVLMVPICQANAWELRGEHHVYIQHESGTQFGFEEIIQLEISEDLSVLGAFATVIEYAKPTAYKVDVSFVYTMGRLNYLAGIQRNLTAASNRYYFAISIPWK